MKKERSLKTKDQLEKEHYDKMECYEQRKMVANMEKQKYGNRTIRAGYVAFKKTSR